MWISCPRTKTPTENVDTPSASRQISLLEAMLGELGRLSCLETRHGAFSSTFRRRTLRGGYISWRILLSVSLEGPAGWSFDPSAEGATTTTRGPTPQRVGWTVTGPSLAGRLHSLGFCFKMALSVSFQIVLSTSTRRLSSTSDIPNVRADYSS